MVEKDDFKLLKKNMKERYNSIRSPIRCKCLNQEVHFNAEGFHHLLYDGAGKPRSRRAARNRLTLIPLIVPVLKNAINVSYEKRYTRKNRKIGSPSILTEMWGVEMRVGKQKNLIKVILQRKGNGNIFFRSVMEVKTKNTS